MPEPSTLNTLGGDRVMLLPPHTFGDPVAVVFTKNAVAIGAMTSDDKMDETTRILLDLGQIDDLKTILGIDPDKTSERVAEEICESLDHDRVAAGLGLTILLLAFGAGLFVGVLL